MLGLRRTARAAARAPAAPPPSSTDALAALRCTPKPGAPGGLGASRKDARPAPAGLAEWGRAAGAAACDRSGALAWCSAA
jgi:hypothetical protein